MKKIMWYLFCVAVLLPPIVLVICVVSAELSPISTYSGKVVGLQHNDPTKIGPKTYREEQFIVYVHLNNGEDVKIKTSGNIWYSLVKGQQVVVGIKQGWLNFRTGHKILYE